LNERVTIDESRNEILLPKVFKEFSEDFESFGKTEKEIIFTIAQAFLGSHKKRDIIQNLQTREVKYKENSFTIVQFLPL